MKETRMILCLVTKLLNIYSYIFYVGCIQTYMVCSLQPPGHYLLASVLFYVGSEWRQHIKEEVARIFSCYTTCLKLCHIQQWIPQLHKLKNIFLISKLYHTVYHCFSHNIVFLNCIRCNILFFVVVTNLPGNIILLHSLWRTFHNKSICSSFQWVVQTACRSFFCVWRSGGEIISFQHVFPISSFHWGHDAGVVTGNMSEPSSAQSTKHRSHKMNNIRMMRMSGSNNENTLNFENTCVQLVMR